MSGGFLPPPSAAPFRNENYYEHEIRKLMTTTRERCVRGLLPERPPIEQERHLLALARLELLDGRLERRELRPELSEQLGRRRRLRAEGGGG